MCRETTIINERGGEEKSPLHGTDPFASLPARVITKRAYGVKSADSLWTRLILDLNRASEAIGRSIEQIRQMARGLKALFNASCT